MGLFDFLKGKEQSAPPAEVTFPANLGASAKGAFVPMEQIPDEVCCGIDPADGRVYSPVDGKVTQLTDTLHAVGLEAGGMEVLIHVGVDTVEMNGDGFTNAVKLNQNVKKGDLLLTMDLEKVRAAGHPTTIIMAVTNSDDFASVEVVGSGQLQPGDDLIRVSK